MNARPDAYFKNIIARRDPRFDGRFYFGVKTTGIYCRPVCPAKPKPENIVIFRSPSEAERAGYRSCLRCHPDLAPGMKRPDETEQLVGQALRMIQTRPHEELTIQKLAHKLGITDRHLRRLFDKHLGASPVEIMITQRLHFAKQMIRETSASLTDIAFAVGFESIRRFNEAFKECYRTSPSSFRKHGTVGTAGCLSLKVPIRLPYDWESVLAYLKRHETYGLEHVAENRYRRYVPRGKKLGVVTVSHLAEEDHLTTEFQDIPLGDIRFLLTCVKNLFDTDHNPLHLPQPGKRAARGTRVPGNFAPFETAVAIIVSQRVSAKHAKFALKKVIRRYGRKVRRPENKDVFEFPSPKILARMNGAAVGLPQVRARAIRELARGILKGTIDFNAPGDLAPMKNRLLALHGVTPSAAAMIAIRCLNDPDAFISRITSDATLDEKRRN